jgi:uncharacterized protein (DUF1778 family)
MVNAISDRGTIGSDRSVQSAAHAEIERHARMKLSTEASIAFAKAIVTPPKPNEALRRAAKRHRAIAGE